jgi:hypothetical protein
MRRFFTLGLLVVAMAAAGLAFTARNDASSANSVAVNAATRQAIKSMPILERPNRVGHFYGNTVRRANERGPQRSG